MDELILKATQDINKLMNRRKNLESDGLSTKTQIRAKIKPIMEEIQQLRIDYNNYMYIRDAKIPDHEKLPKTCIYYKHYLQVEQNSKVIKAAKTQIRDDKDLLTEIAQGLSAKKELPENQLLNTDLGDIDRKKR